MIKKFNEWYLKNNSRIQNDFMSYLRINTTTPNEERAYGFIKDYLSGVNLDVEKQYLHENLENHPVYIKNEQSVINPSRFNIKAYSKGNNRKKNKKVLFNVHIDVVPDTEDFPEAFNPYIKDGFMYGRGACDTKNNLIMLVEAIRFLNDNNIPMQKNVELDLVIEEEVSGNGTISSIMHGI